MRYIQRGINVLPHPKPKSMVQNDDLKRRWSTEGNQMVN